MLEIGLGHYLAVAAILFTLGIFGIFLNRKNVIIIREDLAHQVLQVGREGDEVDVHRQQHQLDRHQDDDDILTVQEDAEPSC